MHTKFLIIVPTYLQENFILKCINSIKSQDEGDFVCVVVNDRSPDSTSELLEELHDERIHVIEPVKELGAAGDQVNFGLAYADRIKVEADYETFIDGDNEIECNFTRMMADILDHKPDVNFVVSDYSYRVMDKDQNILKTSYNLCTVPHTFERCLGGYCMGPSMAWRSSFRKRANGVPDFWHNDWRWTLKAWLLGASFFHLRQQLFRYNFSPGNVSHRQSDRAEKYNQDVRDEARALMSWLRSEGPRPDDKILKLWRWPGA